MNYQINTITQKYGIVIDETANIVISYFLQPLIETLYKNTLNISELKEKLFIIVDHGSIYDDFLSIEEELIENSSNNIIFKNVGIELFVKHICDCNDTISSIDKFNVAKILAVTSLDFSDNFEDYNSEWFYDENEDDNYVENKLQIVINDILIQYTECENFFISNLENNSLH